MTQKEKTKFRSSAKWKKFRAFMKKQYNGVDLITGKPLYKGWALHHKDEKNYDDLSPEKFICLNKQTHEVVHWLARYSNYERVCQSLITLIKEMEKYK